MSEQRELIEACRNLLREAGPIDGWTTPTRPVTVRILRQIRSLLETISSPAAELGRRGGKKGGLARAIKLTAQQRSDIARHAAQVRWNKPAMPETPTSDDDRAFSDPSCHLPKF